MTEEKKKKTTYGEFAVNKTPAPSAITLPTYGEFMAQRNAQNAASAFASPAVGNAISYAAGAGYTAPTVPTTYGANAPAGWDKGISYAPTAEGATTYTENAQARGAEGAAAPTTYGENANGGKTVLQLIEEQKNASYADAEAARERAIADAKTSYAQNRATYGKNAEALAELGLAGSGYGEYLDASAYAQQRAEVQAARATESAAKTAADRVYYSDMAAQNEKVNAAFTSLLDAAKGGEYTADEIRTVAQKQGITDTADLDTLAKAAGDEYIQKTITADTSDEEIAAKYAGNEQAAKEARKTMALDEIEGYADGREWTAADEAVEKYYKSGVLDDNDRQSYYMQNATAEIEEAAKSGTLTAKTAKSYEQALEKAKNDGKISSTDYEAAKKYLYASIVTVMDGTNVKITTYEKYNQTSFDIEINGETIKLASHSRDPVDAKTRNALTAVAGQNPKNGTLALYDDGIYIYIANDYNAWYKVSRNWTKAGTISSFANKRIYEIMRDDIAPTQGAPEKPKHTT